MRRSSSAFFVEQGRYTCKAEAAPQFHGWHTIYSPYAQNAADAVIVKDFHHPFVGYSYRPRVATVKQNQAHYCLVDPAFCTQRYFTPRPKTGLEARECGTGKTNRASDLLGALAICDKHRAEIREFSNIPNGSPSSRTA